MENARVLIVDDETSIADLMKDALEFEGLDCHALYSGNQAINYLKEHEVDLIISDVRMPDGDGLALLEFANTLKQPPKLIFITGHSDHSEQVLRDKGALDVKFKPLIVDDFIAEIKSFFL